jgi:hypothetical protein
MWFQNKNDEGIRSEDAFNPFPLPAIALVITAVSHLPIIHYHLLTQSYYVSQITCGLDEWATGVKVDIAFTALEYKSVYEAHLRSLRRFEERCNERKNGALKRIQERLYNMGRYVA